MANMYWRGGSVAVAQVTTFAPDASDGSLYSITAYDDEGHSSKCATVATGTAKAIVEALKAAADVLKANGVGPWDEITATEDDAVLTLTCDTAGKPIYFDVSECADDTLTVTAVTANKGPYDWNDLGNWEGDGDLPGADASDTVYVENAVIKYGLDQSGIANALTALFVTRSQIGQNSIDNFPPSYLQIKAAAASINYHNDPGTATLLSPVNIDFGATQAVIDVYNSPAASGAAAVNLRCNHASTKLNILLGSVAVANYAGESSTLSDINVYGGFCYVGSGVTLTNLLNRAGSSRIRCALTSLICDAGTIQTEGAGAITTLTLNGGTATLNATGTITALSAVKGVADLTKSPSARTVTTAKIGAGGSIAYDPAVVTMTNKVQPYNASGNLTLTAA